MYTVGGEQCFIVNASLSRKLFKDDKLTLEEFREGSKQDPRIVQALSLEPAPMQRRGKPIPNQTKTMAATPNHTDRRRCIYQPVLGRYVGCCNNAKGRQTKLNRSKTTEDNVSADTFGEKTSTKPNKQIRYLPVICMSIGSNWSNPNYPEAIRTN